MPRSQDPTYDDAAFLGGSVEAPAWAVALLGAIVVALGVAHFVLRARRARRAPRLSLFPGKR
jgi:hypothetical protein